MYLLFLLLFLRGGGEFGCVGILRHLGGEGRKAGRKRKRKEGGGGEEKQREKNSSQSSTFPKRNTCPKTHISSLPTFVEGYFLLHFHQLHSMMIPPKSSPKQSPNKDTISTIENIFSLMRFTLSAFLFFSSYKYRTKKKKTFTPRAAKQRNLPPFPFPLLPTTAYW